MPAQSIRIFLVNAAGGEPMQCPHRMSLQMECFGQSRDRFRLLNSAVGVEHKAVRRHLVHDAYRSVHIREEKSAGRRTAPKP